MSSTPALSTEYRKVIPARFVTKRDGQPMLCMTCGTPLAMGEAFAATNGAGWVSYCAKCATSPQAQIAGLVARIEDLVAPLGENIPANIVRDVETATPHIEAVLSGAGDFLATKVMLLAIRQSIGQAKHEVKASALNDNEQYAALRVVAEKGTVRDRDFAKSLADQWARKGNLSDKQMVYVDKLVAKAEKLEVEAEKADPIAQTVVPQGYYAVPSRTGNNDLDFWFVRVEDGTHRTVVKRVIGGHADQAVRRVEAFLAIEAIEKAGLHEAGMTFARELGACMKCNRHLTDEVSRAHGIGPECLKGV